MNRIVFAAATALLLATTAAQAGSGITFQIDGQRVRIESPRGAWLEPSRTCNCSST